MKAAYIGSKTKLIIATAVSSTAYLGQNRFLLEQDRKDVQRKLAERRFTHVARVSNGSSILDKGLLTQFGGSSSQGISAVNAGNPDFARQSQGFIHLGKDDKYPITYKIIPFMKPSTRYSMLYRMKGVDSTVFTVIMPDIPQPEVQKNPLDKPGLYKPVSDKQTAQQKVAVSMTYSIFASTLIAQQKARAEQERKRIEIDPVDSKVLKDAYRTNMDIPSTYIFSRPLEETLRAPDEIGVDGYVPEEVLNTLMPDLSEKDNSEKIEILRGALHSTNETMYRP